MSCGHAPLTVELSARGARTRVRLTPLALPVPDSRSELPERSSGLSSKIAEAHTGVRVAAPFGSIA
jgi:hypothetical protein